MRTKFSTLIGLIGLVFFAFGTQAQQLPAPSPAASVSQTVGLTEITIDYSSPAVKGRTVFGELEPFGKAWRAGANAPTKITFSSDVKIGGKDVKAGSYNIFLTPQAEGQDWTFHFNGAGKSIFAYNTAEGQDYAAIEADDVASTKVKAEAAPMRERLVYLIESVSDSEGKVTLWWDKTMVSFSVETPTTALAEANVEKTIKELNGTWRKYFDIANYYAASDLEKALSFIDKSIEADKAHVAPAFTKAQFLAKQENFDAAMAQLLVALSLDTQKGWFNYLKPQMDASKEEWMSKVSKTWKKKNKKLIQ
ncbi:DUF2911 domain-containing protein [Sediminitomix flava]|uniref:DUF2911 family protein n=1 Tax=Sediminitomix flava TaxID=379075 RepID=A0A315Z8P4_SEDFL|nr:DUF2911 domain-containing protein [Sediminitomix flava]PWJ41028.1 Protein of unknown function (DUF2911) [Sediminitomix flava]